MEGKKELKRFLELLDLLKESEDLSAVITYKNGKFLVAIELHELEE